MPPKIVFVILHYLAIKETIDCVKSIEKNVRYANFNVVVVDNGSRIEKDIAKLKGLESDYCNLKVIVSDKNLGFARGNNIGFLYAKGVLHAEFIILINNDTIVSQPDFCDVIVEKYKEYQYAVLGPKIITKDGQCDSNPIEPSNYAKIALYRHLGVLLILYLTTFVGMDKALQSFIKLRKKNKNHNKKEYKTDMVGLKLHGSCLIFSKKYTELYDGLNPNTFLYMEEDVLFVRLKKNRLVSLYSPDLEILHLEDAATNLVVKKDVSKRRFVYKNHIKSIGALIDEAKNLHKCNSQKRMGRI